MVNSTESILRRESKLKENQVRQSLYERSLVPKEEYKFEKIVMNPICSIIKSKKSKWNESQPNQ